MKSFSCLLNFFQKHVKVLKFSFSRCHLKVYKSAAEAVWLHLGTYCIWHQFDNLNGKRESNVQHFFCNLTSLCTLAASGPPPSSGLLLPLPLPLPCLAVHLSGRRGAIKLSPALRRPAADLLHCHFFNSAIAAWHTNGLHLASSRYLANAQNLCWNYECPRQSAEDRERETVIKLIKILYYTQKWQPGITDPTHITGPHYYSVLATFCVGEVFL